MALWLTLVVVLTCFGGLASPGPVPTSTVLRELIEELDNITQKVGAGCWVLGSQNWSRSGPGRLGLALRCRWVREKPQGPAHEGERGARLGVQNGGPMKGFGRARGPPVPWPGPAAPASAFSAFRDQRKAEKGQRPLTTWHLPTGFERGRGLSFRASSRSLLLRVVRRQGGAGPEC